MHMNTEISACKNKSMHTADNLQRLQQREVRDEPTADTDTLAVINYPAPESTVGR